MSNALARTEPTQLTTVDDPILADSQLWDIVSSGDLKGLSAEQRAQYYLFRCRQEGLNPASQPFTYLVLNGKGVLYGNKTAADQLRKVHGISIIDLKFFDDGEYLTYEITMQDRDGRRDIDVGQVFVGTLKGEQRANARMKAITKAKRRATYSICGTGVLDETEIDSIPGSRVYEDLQAAGFPERQVDADGVITAEAIDALVAEPAPITKPQMVRISELKMGLGWERGQLAAFSRQTVGLDNAGQLTSDQAKTLITALEAKQDELLSPQPA